MKKIVFLITILGLLLSACLPAALQPEAVSPTPISEADLQATAAVFSQQTLQALPTFTVAPSNTPVVTTATATQATPTETQDPAALTLTATLNTFPTSTAGSPFTPTMTITGTLPSTTPSHTPNPLMSATLTGTAHPQHYGTMPPYLPFSQITLINKAKAEVYISLQCTTKDGYFSVIETPVSGTTTVKAPVGKYTYVAWVGGRQIVGKFILDNNNDIKIRIFKDHLEIGQ